VPRRSLKEQTFQITSTVNHAQNQNFTLARPIEDQVFGKPCDWHTASATKFGCRESTRCPSSWVSDNPHQRAGHSLFPTFRQIPASLSFVPIRLLQNIRNRGVAQRNPKLFHARRTRSRSAVTSPFLRISLIETSIFGPFAAASNSCSRLAIRRSLSWRINSRMYSLGVPQSPDATWPST